MSEIKEIDKFSAFICDINLQQDDVNFKKNEINCNNVMLNSSNNLTPYPAEQECCSLIG